MNVDPKQQAEELHEQAQALEGSDDDEALRLYHEALRLDPERPSTLYNIGLIHKYRGEWAESREFNRRSVELRPDDEAANWNLAIAATALGDWRTARSVWHRLGMGIDEGDTAIDANFGLTPVRLNPEGNAEVVWARRICPVRARIESIPFPDSGYRRGDVVLHDGAGTGSRMLDGRARPVFNVFLLFQPSGNATFELEVNAADPGDIQALEDAFDAGGWCVEDWTANIEVLCKACSEGTPHEHHDQAAESDATQWRVGRRLGVSAAVEADVREVLARWQGPGREVLTLALALAAPVVN